MWSAPSEAAMALWFLDKKNPQITQITQMVFPISAP
jgi:hypothetical protein